MAIDPTIRDQAYQFFIEEAPELLNLIEAELLSFSQQRSTTTVHNLMRAAHSIKGGAASVGLDPIATLAHRLENIFKALYSETLEIDTELENQLLQAYDCLRLPLMQQITEGEFDADRALSIAAPILAAIEQRCGEALLQTDSYIPTSTDLGIDLVTSIFSVDVAQGLQQLAAIVEHPPHDQIAEIIQTQIEVFAGFAELLNLSGFAALTITVQQALCNYPDRALEIIQLALPAFHQNQQAILAGDRTAMPMIAPQLIDWATTTADSITHSDPATNFDLSTDFFSTSFDLDTDSSISAEQLSVNAESTESFEELNAALPILESIFTTSHEPFNVEYESFDYSSFDYSEDFYHEEPELDTETEPDLRELFSDDLDVATLSTETEPAISDTIQPDSEFLALESAASEPLDSEPLNSQLLNSELLDSESLHSELLDSEPLNSEPLNSAFFNSEIVEIPESIASFQAPIEKIEDTFEENLKENLEEAIEENIEEIEAVFERATEETEETEGAEETAIGEIVWEDESEDSKSISESIVVAKVEGLVPASPYTNWGLQLNQPAELYYSSQSGSHRIHGTLPIESVNAPNLTIRVDAERLERINNTVGELIINRNGLSLQNEQLQDVVRHLIDRFERFQKQINQFRTLADQMLLTPTQYFSEPAPNIAENVAAVSKNGHSTSPSEAGMRSDILPGIASVASVGASTTSSAIVEFDPLEMDHYGGLHFQMQEILEDVVQLEEAIEDITFFARQSSQSLDQQRQTLTSLQDDVKWARMLPLGEVVNRFPRIVRDLSATYGKSVQLKLTGTEILIDKAILEKLYDPLLHLLRNAFDHGIEPAVFRRQQGKPDQGQIEIRAFHQGNQTVIEVRDDGQGLNLDRIRSRILELGWLPPNQVMVASPQQLLEFIFAPGFSTATQVSELSGRGVGLDVVRSQVAAIKGSLSVTSAVGQGTTFTLHLPLTLTISRLMIGVVGFTAFALSADSVEEIVTPQADQIRQSGTQRFLYWQEQIIPVYHLADLLEYACPLPEQMPGKALVAPVTPQGWASPMLILRQEQQCFALEVDRLVNEQELVIKPFSGTIAPPAYLYGCTILGDGSLVPVIDTVALLSWHQQYQGVVPTQREDRTPAMQPVQTPTILVVDDAIAMRRTLALSLEREGFRVLQARDGWEAIDQLQQSTSIKLVICDVEMPNMNGFEFLSYRRQSSDIAAIPVVMLTSRSNEKHRWLAKQLGATDYFTKPYLEQEFLTAIKVIMHSELVTQN